MQYEIIGWLRTIIKTRRILYLEFTAKNDFNNRKQVKYLINYLDKLIII